MAVKMSMRWRVTELDHRLRLHEVGLRQPQAAEAEAPQRFEQAPNIGRSRIDPHVDVTGVARVAVSGQRITANQEVLNAGGVE